jgi:hypothetical protein
MLCDIEIHIREFLIYGQAKRDTIFNERLVTVGTVALVGKDHSPRFYVLKFEVTSNEVAEQRAAQAVESYKQWYLQRDGFPVKSDAAFRLNRSDWQVTRIDVSSFEWKIYPAGHVQGIPLSDAQKSGLIF